MNAPEWLQATLPWLTLAVMLGGLLGLIIPLFSGILVIWLAALGYGVVGGFTPLGWLLFGLISILMVVGVTIDNVLMGAGAKKAGADWATLVFALVAGILGTLIFPPFGGLILAPLVILLLEYRRQRDWHKAFDALRGLAAGWGLSFIVRLGIGIVMILLWVIWNFAK